MSFIDMALDTREEKDIVAEGNYDLLIEDAQLRDDGKNIMVRLSIEGYPSAKAVFHNISLIQPDDDEEKANNKKLFCAAFLEAFSIPFESGFDVADLMGGRGTVPLACGEYKGVEKNEIVLSF